MLKDVGLQVRTAKNGVEGIEAISAWRPHFIWMDIRKPYRSEEIFDRLTRHLGVRFVYDETAAYAVKEPTTALRLEALATPARVAMHWPASMPRGWQSLFAALPN